MLAVRAPLLFCPTTTRGVLEHDSFAVPDVKLHDVVNVPTRLLPMPATCNMRVSPVSMSVVVPGCRAAGGIAYAAPVNVKVANVGEPPATFRTRNTWYWM